MAAIDERFPPSLAAARLRLADSHPYLIAALWQLVPVPSPGLQTLACDQYWRLYYDPAVLEHHPVAGLSGLLYHELCHLLRGHAQRAEDLAAEPATWLLATDAEINDDLAVEQVTLPPDAIYPATIHQPDFRTAEDYYQALRTAPPDPPDPPAPKLAPSGHHTTTREAPTNPTGLARLLPANWRKQPQRPAQAVVQGHAPAPPTAHRCGSAAHGRPEPWEAGPPDQQPGTPRGLLPQEAILVQRQVARAIAESSGLGTGPDTGHWERWADEQLTPRVDWRRLLAAGLHAAIAHSTGAVDYTYARPSRRQSAFPTVILPSLRQPLPRIGIAVDVSASMSRHLLSQALAEVQGVLQLAGRLQAVAVLAVDNAVRSCQSVFDAGEVRLFGGGGTNMQVAVQALSNLQPRPAIGVVLTDGATTWPATAPTGMQFVIVLLGEAAGERPAPAWAQVIHVEM